MKWILAVCAAVIVLTVLGALVGNYFYNFAIARPKQESLDNAMEQDGSLPQSDEAQIFTYDKQWLSQVGCTDVWLNSRDGLKLHGYYIAPPQDSGLFVIMCHGYRSTADMMLGLAEKYYEMGYGILAPDARGHGQSEGDYVGMGWDERIDITDWCEYLVQLDESSQIVLYGISMGGATVMMTSGEQLPTNVKAVVEDCGYSSICAEFSYQLKQMFKLPSFPVLNCASIVTRIRAGYSIMHDGNAAAQVAQCEIPILFIHGSKDTFVPTEMVYTVYEAACCEKQLLVVEGAGHGSSAATDSELYWSTVFDFLGKYTGN